MVYDVSVTLITYSYNIFKTMLRKDIVAASHNMTYICNFLDARYASYVKHLGVDHVRTSGNRQEWATPHSGPFHHSFGCSRKNNDRRIRQYLSTLQTRVKSEHLLIQIIASLVYMGDGTYDDIEWHCRRRLASIGNAFRLTSSNSYGKLHNGEFLRYQDEIIALVAKPIDPRQDWRSIASCTYQWHEQTNLNWELGNVEPKGINIIEINLVALLWVHLKAREYYRATGEPINEPVLVQRHMVNPMLASYMNISFFNHHRLRAKNIVPMAEFPVATFPRPPLYALALRGAREKQRVFWRSCLLRLNCFTISLSPLQSSERLVMRDNWLHSSTMDKHSKVRGTNRLSTGT